MLSFVIQNFLTSAPFNIKTVRYYLQVKALNTRLFSVFIRSIVYFSLVLLRGGKCANLNPNVHFLFMEQFYKSFWVFFKRLYLPKQSRKQGLYSNNLVPSSFGLSLGSISEVINNPKVREVGVPIRLSGVYLRPVQVFTLHFPKKVYNSFVWYLFNLLTHSYAPTASTYVINYGFLFIRSNVFLCNALNLYYLRVHSF